MAPREPDGKESALHAVPLTPDREPERKESALHAVPLTPD
jgi:hypothetical protein